MLTVILGAGASYDCVDVSLEPSLQGSTERLPPLANELFDPRPEFGKVIDRYPEMLPIVSRIRRAVKGGKLLESELAAIRDEATQYPSRNGQLLAVVCYLRDIIESITRDWSASAHGVTHYQELVDEIEQWRYRFNDPVAFISFNYDTLLEDALAVTYRTQFTSFESYRHERFLLIKPHGSINWCRQIGTDIPLPSKPIWRDYLFRSAARYESVFRFGAPDPTFELDELGVIPAIAMPVEGKSVFGCPLGQVDLLDAVIANTTKLITIGWRGLEPHFLEKWGRRNDLFDVMTVSGDAPRSHEAIANLRQGELIKSDYAQSGKHRDAFDGGFGRLVGSGAIRGFLAYQD